MRLFKYCDTGGLEIIRTSTIKVSPPVELNDPFDCNPTFDVQTPSSRSALEAMILKGSVTGQAMLAGKSPYGLPTDLTPEQLKERWRQVSDAYIQDPVKVHECFAASRAILLVLCLSAEKNHPLMWAHYAKGHQGMVIEFETDLMFSPDDGKRATDTLFKVEYSDTRPSFRFDGPIIDTLKVKGSAWAYENEWRVLYPSKQFDMRVINGREMLLKRLDPSCIKTVYLGCTMPESHCKESIRLLSREQHVGVELYKMKLDDSNYSLRAVQVPLPHE